MKVIFAVRKREGTNIIIPFSFEKKGKQKIAIPYSNLFDSVLLRNFHITWFNVTNHISEEHKDIILKLYEKNEITYSVGSKLRTKLAINSKFVNLIRVTFQIEKRRNYPNKLTFGSNDVTFVVCGTDNAEYYFLTVSEMNLLINDNNVKSNILLTNLVKVESDE